MNKRTCVLGGFYCQECGTPCEPEAPLCRHCGGEMVEYAGIGKLCEPCLKKSQVRCIVCGGERTRTGQCLGRCADRAKARAMIVDDPINEVGKPDRQWYRARDEANFAAGRAKAREIAERVGAIPCGICGDEIPVIEFASHVYQCMNKYMEESLKRQKKEE